MVSTGLTNLGDLRQAQVPYLPPQTCASWPSLTTLMVPRFVADRAASRPVRPAAHKRQPSRLLGFSALPQNPDQGPRAGVPSSMVMCCCV